MENIRIEPVKAFNGIAFHTDREKVRTELSSDFTEFKKTKFSKNTSDDYKVCHVFYDTNNRLQAIETFGDIPALVGDINVFSLREQDLHLIADDFTGENASYTSKKMSMGITFENNKVESVLFAVEGYYD